MRPFPMDWKEKTRVILIPWRGESTVSDFFQRFYLDHQKTVEGQVANNNSTIPQHNALYRDIPEYFFRNTGT